MDRMKILLVDDEHEFVTTLAERLELRNMNVSIATDGETALGFVENDPPQVVVLDVMMPGLSGLEVLEKIKLVAGGSLPYRNKKPPERGGLMIPFVIFDLMVSGISTFWKKGCRAVIEPDLIVPLFMIV